MSRQEWGPYCPLPQECSPRYVHVIYPTARALIRDGACVRDMTSQELDAMVRDYAAALQHSFVFVERV